MVEALEVAHIRDVLSVVWRRSTSLRADLAAAGDTVAIDAINDAYRNSAVRIYKAEKAT